MTSPASAIDLELWQLRAGFIMLALAALVAIVVVGGLTRWEISLREREQMTRIGETYCLSHRIDNGYISPDAWLADGRSDDPLWLALDASLMDACGIPEQREVIRPFVTADGRPVAPRLKP